MKVCGLPRCNMIASMILTAWLALACAAQPPASTPAQPSPTQVSEPAKAAAKAVPTTASEPTPTATQPSPTAAVQAAKPVEAPARIANITISMPAKSPSVLPLFVGVDAGIFRQEGLDVKLTTLPSTSGVAALVSGEIDYITPTGTAFRAAARGMPVKVIAFTANRPVFELLARQEIGSIKDLRGKVLAILTHGSNIDYITRDILKFYGMDPEKDVTLMPTGTPVNSLAALQGGSVQAALLTPPQNAMASKLGFKILAYDESIVGEQIQSGLVASDQKLKNDPAQVKRVLRAALKSVRYTMENRAVAIKVMARDYELDPEIAEGVYDSSARSYSRDGTIGDAAVKEELERVKEEIKVTGDIPPSKVYDLSLLNDVLKELGR